MTQTDMISSDQDDLRLLRESARTLFERAGGSGRARKLRDAGGTWDPEMVHELAEVGVLGVAVPEVNGGLGIGLAAGGVRTRSPDWFPARAFLQALPVQAFQARHP